MILHSIRNLCEYFCAYCVFPDYFGFNLTSLKVDSICQNVSKLLEWRGWKN